MTTTLTVEGMSCDHCEDSVADALADVEGVTDVRVDRGTESAEVEGDADVAAMVAAVDEAGYTAHA
ncbi:heavy-metal-associated domain-containing protein [Haloarcula sp. S1CR25-12]|uniref:Heavy-metal-associated domain-containing protein n=1 Tax=Haloarcula saliterrae TaxID=2950534 RepID=A0ABU2FGJ6_9EURY|nr:heavy-metal-associated domain-containing protein [Haloarcula sp. S1CR25-12]MDS0261371.1 heavy-metal-associated domain-containing protein [Haloarcula sp. S1CR25-12]